MTSQETEGVFTQLAGLSFPQEYTSDLTPELSVASQISLERRKSSPKGQIEVSPSEGIKDRMALNEFNPSPVPYSFSLVIVKNQTKSNQAPPTKSHQRDFFSQIPKPHFVFVV